jgi:hypothetical protein
VRVALGQGDGHAVVVDVALVGDLVDARPAVGRLSEVRVAGSGREQVHDAAGQEVVAAPVHVGGGQAEVRDELLLDAEAEGVGHGVRSFE